MNRYDPNRIKATWHDCMVGIEETFEKFGVTEWQVRPLRAASKRVYTADERRVTVTFVLDGRTIELALDEHDQRPNLWIIWQAVEALRLNRVRGLEKVMGAAYLALEAPTSLGEDPYRFMALQKPVSMVTLNARYRELARQYSQDDEMLKKLNIARDAIEQDMEAVAK